MGKTQSKRSVDITTEAKKGPEDEVTGKLEKIEDVDQKQVNGDTTPQEERKDAEECEHDKDLTTEKSAEITQAEAQACNENGDQNATATATDLSPSSPAPKEDTGAAAKEEGAAAEEISPLTDESNKKSKKEKVKKKWSFRSISFGKKDKQKPAKTEDSAENAAATNGDAEKLPTEEATADAPKKDESGGDADVNAAETLKNGDASDKELNGQKTPTPTEEKLAEAIAATELTTSITINATAVTTTAPAAASVTSSSSNDAMTTNEKQTEQKSAAAVEAIEEVAVTVVVTNGGGSDADKNGVSGIDAIKEAIIEKAPLTVSAAIDIKKIIPCDGEIPHQNGTNAEECEAEGDVAEQAKSKIEEMAMASAKELKENAAAAENNTTTQDLPVACE